MHLVRASIWGGMIIAAGLLSQIVVVTAQVPAQEPLPIIEIDHSSVPEVCQQIGLTAEPLTMAGVMSGQLQPILTELHEADALRAQLAQLEDSADDLHDAMNTLAEALFADPTLPGLAAQLETVSIQFNTAQSEMSQIREQLFDLGTAILTPTQRQALLTCQEAADRRVPPEFRVVQQTDQQWAAIEQALIAEARAMRLDEPVAPEAAALLEEIRSTPAVLAAQQALAAGLETLDAQFGMLALQFASES